jgi:hypothetical protein
MASKPRHLQEKMVGGVDILGGLWYRRVMRMSYCVLRGRKKKEKGGRKRIGTGNER